MNQELHVIFGAGQVGATLAEILQNAGKRVRQVRRSPGVNTMQGDAEDAAFCHRACRGAAVIYHCMNPAYSSAIWAHTLPRYMDNLIEAAGAIGARLVVLDNVYMLGDTGGEPINEDTPVNPCSKKGEIRARVAERLFDAQKRGQVEAVCGRAADFYGPRGRLTLFGDHFWKTALPGKTTLIAANQDSLHTYHYIPDVARGLATLGLAARIGAPLWMLPCQPAVTTREQVCRFEIALGHSIQIKKMPNWLLKPLGIFLPVLKELHEMTYQWDEPFIIDDSKFRAHFNVSIETTAQAATHTVAWAKQTYAER